MYFAGRDITDYLIKLLNKVRYPLRTSVEREITEILKINYVTLLLILKMKKRRTAKNLITKHQMVLHLKSKIKISEHKKFFSIQKCMEEKEAVLLKNAMIRLTKLILIFVKTYMDIFFYLVVTLCSLVFQKDL